MVLSEPATPQILVHCDAARDGLFRLLLDESLVCEQRIGMAIIGNLGAGNSVCKPLLQANETVDGKFAGASRLLDLLRVINKVNLRVSAF